MGWETGVGVGAAAAGATEVAGSTANDWAAFKTGPELSVDVTAAAEVAAGAAIAVFAAVFLIALGACFAPAFFNPGFFTLVALTSGATLGTAVGAA